MTADLPPRIPTGVRRENIQSWLPEAVAPPKTALRSYWKTVGEDALAHLGRRPLRLVRAVDGVVFYHGGALPPVPRAVHQLRTETREGREGVRLWVDSVDGLLGLVEIGVVELHPWGSRVDDIERPDVLTFDLEPGRDVDWTFVGDTAFKLRALLKAEGLDSWPKLTGGSDLHVLAPIEPRLTWAAARQYCKALAQALADTEPDRYTLVRGENRRVRRVFIDYLRNGRGSTAVGAYSPRALKGFPVAAPVSWKDLQAGARSDAFTLLSPPPRPKGPAAGTARPRGGRKG
jgi:bifunctional non-homologous end joining protein LigD